MQRSLIVWFLLAPFLTIAQGKRQSYLSHSSSKDTHAVKFFDSLAYAYANINTDTGIIYGNRALTLARELNWEKGIALSHSELGTNYRASGDYGKALHYYFKSLGIFQKLKQERSIAATFSNIASVYRLQGNYARALEYHLKALADMERVGDRKSQAIIMGNIGTLHKDQGDYAHALEYYNAALKLNMELGDSAGLAREYGNMGIVYEAQGLYDKALDYHSTALQANKRLGNKYGMQINTANLAIVYSHLGALEKSLSYHLNALRLSEEIGNKNSIAINLGNVGETYLAIAKRKSDEQALTSAVRYLERAVMLCREIGFLAPVTEFIPYLTEAYTIQGNFQEAYKYQKLFTAIKDSIFSVESKLQLANLEAERKIELKEKNLKLKEQQIKIIELKLADKRTMQVIYLMGIVILLLVLGITLKSILNYRRSNSQLMREKKLHTDTILDQHTKLTRRNKLLEEMAHKHSHDIRGYITTIMGLSQLFNKKDYTDPTNKTIIEGISESVESLDNVIKEIVEKETRED